MRKFLERNLNKTGLTFILVITLIIASPILAKAEKNFPKPTNLKYVNDYVGVIDDETKEYIVSVGNELEKKTGAQMSVVVIDSLEGSDVESYANTLFRQWGLGQKGKDNGVMILLSVKDKKWRVEVGRGLEGRITDIYSSRVMEQIAKPLLKEEKYGEAMKKVYSVFADDVAKEYNVTLEKNEKVKVPQKKKSGGGVIPAIIFIIILLSIFGGKGGRRGRRTSIWDLIFLNSLFSNRRNRWDNDDDDP
ncbi:TPM domain-containing protein, partial [Clostridium sp.]|uniref:TPM domain-containing protein n=1 Tax=Clostridium sp. TaxID=1506 RepID=UPI00257D1533